MRRSVERRKEPVRGKETGTGYFSPLRTPLVPTDSRFWMADRPGCVVRQAMTAALSIMSEANKKGAPGRCHEALGPMKCAKLCVKSAGPIRPVKPLMLAMAP